MLGCLVTLVLSSPLITEVPEPPDAASAFTEAPLPFVAELGRDTGRVALRPFVPRLGDLWLLVPAAAATTVAFVYDVPIYQSVRHHLPDPLVAQHRLSYWGSYLGEGDVDVGIFGVLGVLGGPKAERAALAGGEALLATAVVSRGLKLLIREERPTYDGNAKHFFSRNWLADSMPSGHAMSAFATAAVIARFYPNLAPLAYMLASYVGVARVQQGAHWLSDVLIGATLGTMFGWAAADVNQGSFYGRVTPLVGAGSAGLSMVGAF